MNIFIIQAISFQVECRPGSMPFAAAAVNYDFDYKTIVACFRDCSSWCLRVNIIKYFPLSRKTFNSGKVTFQGGPEHLPILVTIWTLKTSLGNEFNRLFNVGENNNRGINLAGLNIGEC